MLGQIYYNSKEISLVIESSSYSTGRPLQRNIFLVGCGLTIYIHIRITSYPTHLGPFGPS